MVDHEISKSRTSRLMSIEIILPYLLAKSRDSSVGIATCYGLHGPGIESRWEARFSAPVKTGPVAHQASYTVDIESLSRG